MTKTIACPECNGHGCVVTEWENAIVGHICENCHGSGTVEVPMTRADNIRSMNDEKLALKIAEVMLGMQKLNQENKVWDKGLIALQKVVLESIQMPMEEEEE